jgi:dCTP diphosphatase
MPQQAITSIERRRGAPAHDASLEEIAARLRDFRQARDWQRFHTPRNLAMSIAVECGELLEHFQWVDDEDLAAHLAAREEDVAEELADVAIYLVQLADTIGVSLSEAIEHKIERNDERYPVESSKGTAKKHTELQAARGRNGIIRPANTIDTGSG